MKMTLFQSNKARLRMELPEVSKTFVTVFIVIKFIHRRMFSIEIPNA